MRPKRELVGRIAVWVVRVLAHMLLRIECEGIEQIPRTGAVVMLGNHINFLDPVLPYILARRYVKGLTAMETYRRFLFNFLAWAVDAIPVERGAPDRQALHACIEALNAGWALYVAPEGTRSGHGRMQRGRAGVVLILLHAGADIPIYPMAFIGLEHFWPNLRRLRRTRVCVRVGMPFYLRRPGGPVRQAVREQMMDEIMGQIAALLPPEHRGVYADQVGRPLHYIELVEPTRSLD